MGAKATGKSIVASQWKSANLALAPNNGAEILLVIRLGNPEPHILVAKIFGIKMPRIGKDRCEAICQASNQNQTKIKRTLLCNLKSITPTLTTQKKQNPPS
jgi:hypothetical protein